VPLKSKTRFVVCGTSRFVALNRLNTSRIGSTRIFGPIANSRDSLRSSEE
jgi:hypothetical protein